MESSPESVPASIADLIAQVNRARAEAQDRAARLETLQRQYAEIEAICGTQADDLARLRKMAAEHIALREERTKLVERLTRLQTQVNELRSFAGTLRLLVWQIFRLPGLLLRRK